MMNNKPKTLVVKEYGSYISVKSAAGTLGISETEFWQLLQKAISQISNHNSSDQLIETRGLNSFRFTGISGIIALRTNLRIEIVPKFLKEDALSWRDDFLSIAILSQKGSLLQNIPMTAKETKNADLYDIFAQAWLNLFEANSRYLLRTYINTTWRDFFLDGDVDEEDIVIALPGGYLQKGIRLSRSNEMNKILYEAVSYLKLRVTNPRTFARIDRAVSLLRDALKEPRSTTHKAINLARDNRWKTIIELSNIINSGNSLGFSDFGLSILPGYILRTHYAWEALIQLAIKKAFPDYHISKSNYRFGQRSINGKIKQLKITPDISIKSDEAVLLLVDSKYKITDDLQATISSSDIYESLAFLDAAEVSRIILVYPNKYEIQDNPLLNQPIEIYSNGDNSIVAVSVSVSGISGKHGFRKIVDNIHKLISPYLLPD